jgi:glycosyltransferase involved in cell wall biosynthesis
MVEANKNSIVFVGRLEKDTGVLEFLKWLKKNPKYHVDFCGDGDLRKECEKFGAIHGFTDPRPYYKKAEYCVPGGYLAALEALSYGCKLKLFWNNKLKEDYWKMSPFVRKDVKEWAKRQTWDKVANEYLDLYNNAK